MKNKIHKSHDVTVDEDTRYGFIFEGVHFERMCSDKSGIYVYIASKAQQKIIRVTRGGKITLQNV